MLNEWLGVVIGEPSQVSCERLLKANETATVRLICGKRNRHNLTDEGGSGLIDDSLDIARVADVSGKTVNIEQRENPLTAIGPPWILANLRHPEFDPGALGGCLDRRTGKLRWDAARSELVPVLLERGDDIRGVEHGMNRDSACVLTVQVFGRPRRKDRRLLRLRGTQSEREIVS